MTSSVSDLKSSFFPFFFFPFLFSLFLEEFPALSLSQLLNAEVFVVVLWTGGEAGDPTPRSSPEPCAEWRPVLLPRMCLPGCSAPGFSPVPVSQVLLPPPGLCCAVSGLGRAGGEGGECLVGRRGR